MSDKPETYTLDLPGGNGTPFRFVYWPNTGTVAYFDRRHAVPTTDRIYQPYIRDENGQACGGHLTTDDFFNNAMTGMHGWHKNDAWDVDRAVMVMVGDWLETIMDRDPR